MVTPLNEMYGGFQVPKAFSAPKQTNSCQK